MSEPNSTAPACDLQKISDAYEAMYAAVPEEARRFAAETWGGAWSHAEMGSLIDFAEILQRHAYKAERSI